MKISFVIPCYNTTNTITKVLVEIDEAVSKRPDCEYEVVLVNDASPKRETIDLLQQIVEQSDKPITLVDLAHNAGQPNAILEGCRHASGDLIMTSDDDGQTPLDKLDLFIDKLNEGYDVVCANYAARPKTSFLRKMGSQINRAMSSLLIPRPSGVEMSTIFLARRFVIDEIIKYDQPYAYISGLLLRVTQNIGNVCVEQRNRDEGTSGYNFKKLLLLWLNGATAFSIKPLRIANGVGFFCAIAGFLLAAITIIRKLILVNVQVGWSSLISVFLILSGINLVVLGIIGEYIGRIYLCINKTPQAVVKNVYVSKAISENTVGCNSMSGITGC